MFVKTIVVLHLSCICFTQACHFLGSFDNHRLLLKMFMNTGSASNMSEASTKWIEQPLDHFNENENRTWKMRYFEKLDYWQPEGPVYLFITGEWTASDKFLLYGLMHDIAKESNGAMYSSEHRYYGESKPFEIFTTDNLAYLSSRQALADVANLLKEIKQLPQYKDSKVVIVGGFYSGNLAAWLKSLYPELVDAAIASSAPVLAKKDFFEYIEAVSDDYEKYGTPGCHEAIRKEFKRYDELFQTNAGIETIKKELKICESSDLTKPENRQMLFDALIGPYKGQAQYGTTESIKYFCNTRYNISKDWSDVFSECDECDFWNEEENCYDFNFDDMIEHTAKDSEMMAWIYQTCTEFGYFHSTSSSNQPFTDNVPVEYYINICMKLYGPEFNEKRVDMGVEKANEMYGGLNPNVTHVVFVNGELDPWARLGVLEDLSPDAPAKVIPRASHCRDFDDPNNDEELKEARKYVKQLIKQWIKA